MGRITISSVRGKARIRHNQARGRRRGTKWRMATPQGLLKRLMEKMMQGMDPERESEKSARMAPIATPVRVLQQLHPASHITTKGKSNPSYRIIPTKLASTADTTYASERVTRRRIVKVPDHTKTGSATRTHSFHMHHPAVLHILDEVDFPVSISSCSAWSTSSCRAYHTGC